MSCTGRTTSDSPLPVLIFEYSTSKALAPSSCIGWRTVVSGGCRWRATGTSSKPVIATSWGTRIPRCASAWITPKAVWSLAQRMARGNLRPASRKRPTPAPAPRRAVVALPGRPRLEAGAESGSLFFECARTRPVVGAVGTSGDIAEAPILVVGHQVTDQRPNPRLVVASDVQGSGRGGPGQGHDRDHVRQPRDSGRREHAVVEDQAVRLDRERGNPCRHVVVVESDGADQQVEAATLCPHFDAPIDDVDEEEALVLALEEFLVLAPEDDADDLFQAVGKGARSAIAHEAELANRAHDPLPGLGTRAALAVEA